MLDQTLAAAFIDNGVSHRILGKTLRPFCLWHRLLLQAIDSPFLKKENVVLRDLRTAVGICQLRFADSKIIRPRPGFSFIRRGLQGEVDAFLLYAGDYLSRPEYDIVPQASSKPQAPRGAAPEIFRVVCDIIGWTHWPEAYVWELPIGVAYWYGMMAQRAAGVDVDVMTDEERKFQSEMMEEHGLAQPILIQTPKVETGDKR